MIPQGHTCNKRKLANIKRKRRWKDMTENLERMEYLIIIKTRINFHF